MIDADGFRPNVGIIISNRCGQLLWARRVGGVNAWQFPQGGINHREKPQDAMYRELYEEIGLKPADVSVTASTRGWLRYKLPKRLIRKNQSPVCVGQKQKWFLLTLTSDDSAIHLDAIAPAEFDDWAWVSYWYPLNQVVAFKRDVYRKALKELAPAHSQIESRYYRHLTRAPS